MGPSFFALVNITAGEVKPSEFNRRTNIMRKTVLFALPLVALMLAVACKKQEAVETPAPAATEQVAGTAAEAAPAAVAGTAAEAAPAAAPVKAAENKGK